MAAHHEQAVRMAELALQRTNDSQIRVVPIDIAARQRHQIGVIRSWLEAWGRPANASAPSPFRLQQAPPPPPKPDAAKRAAGNRHQR